MTMTPQGQALLDEVRRATADDAKAVDLGSLIRITKEMADRTRARLAGTK